MSDSWGDGWNQAYWMGYDQNITLPSGVAGTSTFDVIPPPPPPPTIYAPTPPVPPGYLWSVLGNGTDYCEVIADDDGNEGKC